MSDKEQSMLTELLCLTMGQEPAHAALGTLDIPDMFANSASSEVRRETCAMALGIMLFADLLERVPSGRGYVEGEAAAGRKVIFDHGALRTIRFAEGQTGALPGGRDAFARIFEPLGYRVVGTYPLPHLRMVGYVYCHEEHPEILPQYFVSELEVAQFDAGFGQTAHRVFAASADPIDDMSLGLLDCFARTGAIGLEEAAELLPILFSAFGRQHGDVRWRDYESLLAISPEAAWIATEGNAFNHATDRVEDVTALAERLRVEGAPIKQAVEVSQNGRVRQTALLADPVRRTFLDDEGALFEREVPGSFYEFITRDLDPETGGLDLTFDSSNATGIFSMTRKKAS